MLGIVGKEPQNVTDTRRSFLDKMFKDREGRVALAALPNLPISVWLAATILGMFVKHGHSAYGVRAVAYGALFTWAWLELFDGVNYFRRLLGLLVLLLLLTSATQSGKLT